MTVGRFRAGATVAALALGVGLWLANGSRTPAPEPPVVEPIASADSPLTDQERRGREFYETGVGHSDRPAMARVGDNAADLPASLFRCVNCHGPEGRGVAEGGIAPPDITWDELTKPYRSRTSNGRTRSAYDEAALKRTLALGLDSDDHPLQTAMPRYRLAVQDADDLVSYLKRLGHCPVPGVTPATIRLGCLLPSDSSTASAVGAALQAYFDRVNATGGLYGRKVELRFVASAGTIPERVAQARRLVEEAEVFALVACHLDGAERELETLAMEAAIPMVGALTLFPREDSANRQVFQIDGGIPGESIILIDRALREPVENRSMTCALLVAPTGPLREVADLMKARIERGGGSCRTIESATSAGELKRAGVDTLLLLDAPERILPLLRVADAEGWHPRVLVAGSLANPSVFEVPKGFEPVIRLAFSSPLALGSRASLDAYRSLKERSDLTDEHLPAQLSALASAAVMVEAIKRSGRSLTRETLIAQVEHLAEFPTDFSPPVTFHSRRHIGVRGAFVVGLRRESRKFERLTGWIEPGD